MKHLRIALILILLIPLSAFASEAEHSPYYLLIWQSIDLLIFIAIILFINFFAGNPIKTSWKTRGDSVEKGIADANTALLNAEERLMLARTNIDNLDQAIADVIEKIKQETEVESARLLQAAQNKANALINQAKNHAELERATSEKGVKNELVENIIKQTANRLKLDNSYASDKVRRFATVDMLRLWKAEHSAKSFGN
ncbi:MAG: ATP synthase F0 subunit B [Bdellovibrionota bacterium]|jgi:F0F1-type ATP synthase membrane subunit b/b'